MSKRSHAPGQGRRTPPVSGRKPSRALCPCDIDQIGDDLMRYHRQFHGAFQRREQRHCSAFYLCGQLSALVRKTIEPMVLALHGSDLNVVRALQQFIGQGQWSARDVIKHHQQFVAQSLGDPQGVLIVDGSGFPKQGPYSAGAAYQYCGHLGKLANCQEGVFLLYASQHGHTFLDGRLYLPENWFDAEHQRLRERCGIRDDIIFQTEPAIGLQMVSDVHTADVVPFQWVACDEHFGQNTAFLDGIAGLHKWYFAEVPSDTHVWLRTPAVQQPGRGPMGRPRIRPRLAPRAPRSRALRDVAASLPARAWTRYQIKEGSQGPMWADFAFLRVTMVRAGLPGPRVWAILRRALDTSVLKFHLSNAPLDCERRALAQLSGWRWPIETTLAEAKGEVGMDHYETRSWAGWHHHMVQTFLAHHFLVCLQLRLKKSAGAHHRPSSPVGSLCVAG